MSPASWSASVVTSALTSAYGSFGVAWRLLDDLQDIESDRKDGSHSAIYYSLPEGLRISWKAQADGADDTEADGVAAFLEAHGVRALIMARIVHELNAAGQIAEACGMQGLAAEFHALARPLRNSTSQT